LTVFPQAVWASFIAQLHLVAGLQCPLGESLCESSCSNRSDFHTLGHLNRASQYDDPGFIRARDVLNRFLKVGKVILMPNLKQLRMICHEIQSELEIVVLFILSETKPAHNGDALKRDIIRYERINVRARVATQGTGVDDGSTVINYRSQVVDRSSADGIESHFKPMSSEGLANLFFPIAIAR
jgi:hypothetical protein